MQPESFFHVALKVDDLEGSTAFYVEQFDAEVVERGRAEEGEGATAVNHVALSVADKLVYLFDCAPYEAAGLVDSVPTGFLHFGFVVEDVAVAREEITDAGAEVVMEPTEFGDLKVCFLTDPAGVRVELIEHL
jgi:predicted enzyme related to lactoylglutathione lyase